MIRVSLGTDALGRVTSTEEVGHIAAARVPSPQGLDSLGRGTFAVSPTWGPGCPVAAAEFGESGTVASGSPERPNVDPTQGLTETITTQEGFQANSRIIATGEEMLQRLLALRR